MIAALLATVVTLVDPSTSLTPQPPLAPPAGTAPRENDAPAFPQRVDSREVVTTAIDANGRPLRINVEQHLTLTGTGDYEYSVPAPVLSVAATRDSQSAPGQRAGAILWAGFSDRRRVLGARARLDPRVAAPYLPLRVTVRGSGVTLTNATGADAPSAAADGDVTAITRAVARARRGIFPHGGVAIPVRGPLDARTAHIEAPLAITGTIGGQRIDVVLGDGQPLTRIIPGHGPIRLTARAVPPKHTLLLTPGLGARRTLAVAEDAFLRAARAQQYQAFLANPGPPAGHNDASYVFVTATDPAVVRTRPPASHVFAIALAALGALVLGGAALVAWAHL